MSVGVSDRDLEVWGRDGMLVMPGLVPPGTIATVSAVVDDMAGRPDGDRGLIQHHEIGHDGAGQVQICRSEHFADGFVELGELLVSGVLPDTASALLGEPAVLYKEKVNYKLPGGAGFAPHQDAPAYPFIDRHVTCMVAVDDATEANGCLEVAPGRHGSLSPMNAAGCIRDEIAAGFDWVSVPLRAGDVLWFHSLAPHRSGPNVTSSRRRGMFCTYNARSDGELRDEYYAEKLRRFAGPSDADRTRVSLIGDFRGRAPTDDELRDHLRSVQAQGFGDDGAPTDGDGPSR